MSADDAEQKQKIAGTEITSEKFLEWRSPRLGKANPDRMNNPVWNWLIRSRLNAFAANEQLGGPSPIEAGPGWCFDRFGQSSTQLSDGRIVLVAGEHEDRYDPDFYIYNDVVLLQPNGSIDIYGYPQQVFPPTDFHTATLVGNKIIIIGCLGYPKDRKPGITPVYILDVETFAISLVATVGAAPGWLHNHEAILADDGDSILVRRGDLDCGGTSMSFAENLDDWALHLTDKRWEQLTKRRWQSWEVFRKDRKLYHLWRIQYARWMESVGWTKELEGEMKELEQALRMQPDLSLIVKLYDPAVPHEVLPDTDEKHNVHRIRVNGVIVRYVEESSSVKMTVEGELPAETIAALTSDLASKISTLENTPIEVKKL